MVVRWEIFDNSVIVSWRVIAKESPSELLMNQVEYALLKIDGSTMKAMEGNTKRGSAN